MNLCFYQVNGVDYQQASAALMEKLGDIDELYEKTLKLMRKVEFKSGNALPRLSFSPESK